MITWLRELIERSEHEAAETDKPVTREYYWCTCERPISTEVYDESAPGFVCDCGGIIRQYDDAAGDAK